MVLDYVGDDKPTLAKCMRASLQFNLLAAPRLYSNLRWGARLPYPLKITYTQRTILPTQFSSGHLVPPRPFPTKQENLQHIQTFRLHDHTLKDCARFASKAVRPEDVTFVPVLHYSAGATKKDRRMDVNHLYKHYKSRCLFLPLLAPTKLVITKAHFTELLPIRSIDQRCLKKIVVITSLKEATSSIEDPQQPQHIQTFRKNSSGNPIVVYMFTELDADDCTPSEGISMFTDHLAEVIYGPKFANEIILVNATGRLRTTKTHTRYSSTKTFIALQVAVQAILVESMKKVKSYWSTSNPRARHLYKRLSVAEGTTVKCMDSREYLEIYETEGEFTDEERARLMVTDM